ncbi:MULTISPECIES: tetratricopeptide repeat protein [unclassified Modicisalibacter]|uniref:O-linked N-acetylglucosamine transferase, SPINDLY family protein n=1 Tax=unclassified Modicisalibacter TaxID=2679913 RepID=UPI001CCFCF50|nr:MULTISPECIES: tetratricopeptide repeat protein [unclassified Modicisalibacter]MBZ9556968.1 tetratricopeptide repeat protein [Modicisalibacter sp. R2A 31.J]MBZ9574318.1 tetratricopeptide repeat protein [Modicisalibacter sp. MOD 31.J]
MSKPSKRKLRHNASPRQQPITLEDYRKLTQQQPSNAFAWKKLAALLVEQGHLDEANSALEFARELNAADHEVPAIAAKVLHRQGQFEEAVASVEKALELKPDYARAHHYLSYLLYSRDDFERALEHVETACRAEPENDEYLTTKGNILIKHHRHRDAIKAFQTAAQVAPKKYYAWNNLANAKKDVGLLDEALSDYRQALKVNPEAIVSFSNLITTLHYHPGYGAEEIFTTCKEWNSRFAPVSSPIRPRPDDLTPERRIRIGMFSDGFRGHPVGRMTIAALEKVPAEQIEFYLYSTTNAEDSITQRFKALASEWKPVQHLPDQEFAELVVADEIDILVDLCGHNAGNRMRAMASQPAPLLVKWVGGLINTTGIEAIDYLICDAVETPPGVDGLYTEKLIRLPNDYICYEFPSYTPEGSLPPALKNGYVTLGCFNNPTKINDTVLREWAGTMHALPNSRLFLKGQQFSSEELCDRVRSVMEREGIESERLLIEGPSGHQQLLASYNRVDIALDPWPYSGGLTTCEALMMGVPVVTLPGPTFAGRHSATHLVNAGMPELVVTSWEEYRARVLELASDLDSLATIRSHLRQVLLESPVCDARRFAGHFTMAMRAIWQRHCADKAPEALTFDKHSRAWFEDDGQPLDLEFPQPSRHEEGFHWRLEGKIVAIDNGGRLLGSDTIGQMLATGSLELIAFDPTGDAAEDSLKHHDGVHYYPNVTLGDGQPATLHACLDPAMSGSLAPLDDTDQPDTVLQGRKVLTRLPLGTVALDRIEGLPSIDWLVLDARNDSATILDQGESALRDTLLIQARVAFQPTHERQPNLAELQHWGSRHGFRLYRLHHPRHRSAADSMAQETLHQATELVSAEAIFLPTRERLEALDDGQLLKLSFILHTAYGIRDLSYKILQYVDDDTADRYLTSLRENAPAPRDMPSSAPNEVTRPPHREDTISHEIDRLLSQH